MADFSFSFSVNCSQHTAIPVTHACTLLTCTHSVLVCTQCLLENLDHAQEHRQHMVPMSQFAHKFYKNIQEIKGKLLPFQEILKCKEEHLGYYSKFIRNQKSVIEKEMSVLQEQLNFFLDKLKMSAFRELEENQKYLVDRYERLDDCFSIPELKFINVHSESELNEKIGNFPKHKVEAFLMSLRAKISQLIDPKGHSLYGSVNDICSEIHNFRKQETAPLSFSAASSKYLKPFFADVEGVVSHYVSSFSHLPPNYKDLEESSKHTRSKDRSVSPKTRDEIKFPKSPMHMKSHVKPLSQNEKSILVSSEGVPKEQNLNILSQWENDFNVSALAFLPLEKNLLLVSTASSELHLGEIQKNMEINTLVSFKIQNDPGNFLALTKLSPEGTEGIYFSAGNEKGNIYIWKAESVLGPGSDSKPMAALMSGSEGEAVTCLQDLRNGSHLLSGSSRGSIMLWDYMMGALVKKFQSQSSAIIGFNLFNSGKNLVSGSVDGVLTFWNIKRERRQNDFEEVSLEMFKKHVMDSPLSCIGSMLTFEQGTIVCDENGTITLLDNYKFRVRIQLDVGEECVLDFLSIEGNSANPKEKKGILLAFTKSRILLIDINTFEIEKVFNSKNSKLNLSLNPNSRNRHKSNIVSMVGNEVVMGVIDMKSSPVLVSTFAFSLK